MGTEFWLLFFTALILVTPMVLIVVNLEARRQHQLKLKEAERQLIEARTKEQAEANRRLELEYQRAPVELESHGRRIGGATELGAIPQD